MSDHSFHLNSRHHDGKLALADQELVRKYRDDTVIELTVSNPGWVSLNVSDIDTLILELLRRRQIIMRGTTT